MKMKLINTALDDGPYAIRDFSDKDMVNKPAIEHLKQLVNDLRICTESNGRCDGCSRIYTDKSCSTLTKEAVDAMVTFIEILEPCETSLFEVKE